MSNCPSDSLFIRSLTPSKAAQSNDLKFRGKIPLGPVIVLSYILENTYNKVENYVCMCMYVRITVPLYYPGYKVENIWCQYAILAYITIISPGKDLSQSYFPQYPGYKI